MTQESGLSFASGEMRFAWFGLPVMVLLLVQVTLYLWMAPRGFDFTDESYYLLNYLHWRGFSASVTFFGAYFELPFRLLGQSLAAIRVLSLMLLMACTGHAAFAVLRFVDACGPTGSVHRRAWPFVVAAMTASMTYFGFLPMLRAPSYNLAALCSTLLATASLVRLVLDRPTWRLGAPTMFAYGLVLGVCVMSKASAALGVIGLHLTFLAIAAERRWLRANLTGMVVLAALGMTVHLVTLALFQPEWPDVLRRGVALVATTDGRGLRGLLDLMRWDLQRSVARHWMLGVCLLVTYAVARRVARGRGRSAVRLIDAAVVIACGAFLAWRPTHDAWWLVVALGTTLLLAATWTLASGQLGSTARPPINARRRLAALVLLLLPMPLALSFGTGMSVDAHSEINAVFALLALLAMLRRLDNDAAMNGETAAASVATAVAFAAVALPGLAIQSRALLESAGSYRQRIALGSQDVMLQIAAPNAWPGRVDAVTAETLATLVNAARMRGWTSGQPMFDFTGDGPGLVVALGGRPIGVPWLLGGYPGSRDTAGRLVAATPADGLRHAWLLTSETNPRRIENWDGLLRARLGERSHVALFTMRYAAPYRWGKSAPETIDVTLWRPAAASPSTP